MKKSLQPDEFDPASDDATDAAIEQMKRGGFLGIVRERLRQKLKADQTKASS